MGVLGINHLAFRTPDPELLRRFYLELTGAEELEGEHRPLRLGHTLIAFFPSKSPGAAADPDEIAFDVDGPGFADVLERARRLGCQIRGPLEQRSSRTTAVWPRAAARFRRPGVAVRTWTATSLSFNDSDVQARGTAASPTT